MYGTRVREQSELCRRDDKKSVDDQPSVQASSRLKARGGAHGDASIQSLMLEVCGRCGGRGREGKGQRAAAAATTAALSHEWKMLSVTTVDWK